MDMYTKVLFIYPPNAGRKKNFIQIVHWNISSPFNALFNQFEFELSLKNLHYLQD
jgi:hypothetical protein